MRGLTRLLLALALCFCFSTFADTFEVIGWNLESGDNQPSFIASEIADFEDFDLWALSEVDPKNAEKYRQAAAVGEDTEYEGVLGTTGHQDSLMILFDKKRFRQIGRPIELRALAMENGRAPLGVELEIIKTGERFIFMTNHLYRGNEDKRLQQAIGLQKWMKAQTLPVIAAGDYNFDFEVPGGPGNSGFEAMTIDESVTWVRPEKLIKTNADPNYNTVLDFVFINGAAKAWKSSSQIWVREGDFPDTKKKSDHRPILATFETSEYAVYESSEPSQVVEVDFNGFETPSYASSNRSRSSSKNNSHREDEYLYRYQQSMEEEKAPQAPSKGEGTLEEKIKRLEERILVLEKLILD